MVNNWLLPQLADSLRFGTKISAIGPSPTRRHVRFLVAIRGTVDVKDIEFCPALDPICRKSRRHPARLQEIENFRIRKTEFLNQNSLLGRNSAKIFFGPGAEIVFRQYQPHYGPRRSDFA
jgi:hypothetical protein